MHIPGIKVGDGVQRRRRLRPDAHRAARPEPRPVHRERPSLRTPRRRRSCLPIRSPSGRRGSRARGPMRPSWRSERWSKTRWRPPTRLPSAASRSRSSIRARSRRSTWRPSLESLRKTMRLAIAHEAHRTGGFGAELAALCQEHAFEYLDAPIERVASLDVPIPCGPEWSEVYPDASCDRRRRRASLRRSGPRYDGLTLPRLSMTMEEATVTRMARRRRRRRSSPVSPLSRSRPTRPRTRSTAPVDGVLRIVVRAGRPGARRRGARPYRPARIRSARSPSRRTPPRRSAPGDGRRRPAERDGAAGEPRRRCVRS